MRHLSHNVLARDPQLQHKRFPPMRPWLTILIFVAMLGACTKQRAVVAPERPTETTTASTNGQQPLLGGTNPADSLVISLQRTPCFGTCKAYTINVYRSGRATYFGHSHVQLEGAYQAQIGADTIQRIITDAEKSGFYQFQDKYDREVTDLPSSILRVVANGKDKRVVARVGTPESFKQLFGRVEELLFPVVWTPVQKAQ